MVAVDALYHARAALARWKALLVIGTPVVLAIAYWLFSKRRTPTTLDSADMSSKSEVDLVAQISLDSLSDVDGCHDSEDSDQHSKAIALKNMGNRHFREGRYQEAIKFYDSAIRTCPENFKHDLAVFHVNRASALEKMMMYSDVCADCSQALELNPKYAKAFRVRARAYEMLKDFEKSLDDISAASLLEGFQAQHTIVMAGRILKELCKSRAKFAMASRTLETPSKHFVKAYFASFTQDPFIKSLPSQQEASEENCDYYTKAGLSFLEEEYDGIIPACECEIETDGPHKTEALLLLATFHFLMGERKIALEELTHIIDMPDVDTKIKVNALIKRALVNMQLDNTINIWSDFCTADSMDPTNPDVHHHRGQVLLQMNMLNDALVDFHKAVAEDPNFVMAWTQKSYTEYKLAHLQKCDAKKREVISEIEKTIEKFPDCAELYTLLAEIFIEEHDFEKADSYFQKSIQLQPKNAPLYVHRGLLHLQWTGNPAKVVDLISHALEIDEKCEYAYETLGIIEAQRNNFSVAIELFDKAIQLAKSEEEMVQLMSIRRGIVSQTKVANKLGIPIPNIGSF